MSRGARYSKQSKSDNKSVSILKYILDTDQVYCDVKENDKIPNHDGYIELIHTNGDVLGKIEVQIKTLRKNYKKATLQIDKKYLDYVIHTAQLPFIFIAVDQESSRAYWKHLTIIEARVLLEQLHKSKKKSIAIVFPKDNLIPVNPPYVEWQGIIREYKKRIDQNEFISKKLVDLVSNETHILCQLNQLIEIIWAEMSFIPIHILIQIRPLNLNRDSYYSNYTLNSDNEDLVQFFNSFEIRDQTEIVITNSDYFDGVENVNEKLTTVLKHLTSNLIYYVEIDRQVFDIRLFHKKKCLCARCQIEKFNFLKVDFNINVKDTPIEDLMNRAYAHYKVGQFISAYHLYKEVVELSNSEGKNLSKYMALTNMSHLATLINASYYLDDDSRQLVTKLREIDLSLEICTIKNEFDKEIVEWMSRDYYIKFYYTKINDLKDKLVDHYYISLNDGHGNNNYVNELANAFAQMDQYLQQNMVINDCYQPYRDMVEMFIEGLFASYAVQNKRSSKINELNDWVLGLVLKHGRPKSIRKLANRYKIKSINYYDQNNDDSIKELIIRLFQNYDETYTHISSLGSKEPNHNYFQDNYRRWQSNALQLVRLMNFDDEFTRKFASVFTYKYPTQSLYLDPFEITAFVSDVFNILTKKQLGDFLKMGLQNKQLQRSNFWFDFSFHCEQQNIFFELYKYQLRAVMDIEIDSSSEAVMLIDICRCMSDSNQRAQIKRKVESLLNESFSFELWYKAVIHDMIPYNSKFLNQAIEKVKPKDYSNSPIKPSTVRDTPAYHHQLNQFLSLCFKNEIDLKEDQFNSLRGGYNTYYQWLFDLESFNYDEFEIDWLKENRTKYYYQRYSKSEVLKKHIEKLLHEMKVENEKLLNSFYVDVFVVGR